MTKITYIPGEIANAAIDEHGNRKPVTRTHHIFDDTKGKSQAEVNTDVDDKFTQVDNEIEALEKQDVIPVDTLPAVATADPKKIYRVVGEDSYTDHMVNASGDGWKTLATYSFPGVDDEPTADSDNLVKSGGVYEAVSQLDQKIEDIDIEHVEIKDSSISLLDNDNNVIAQISKEHSEFKNLKTNGENVITESGLLPVYAEIDKKQDKIEEIESEAIDNDNNEIVFAANDNSVYSKLAFEDTNKERDEIVLTGKNDLEIILKITSEGIYVKNVFDISGNSFLGLLPTIYNKNIICFGDSILQGVGAPVGKDAITEAEKYLAANMINCGIGGTTMNSSSSGAYFNRVLDGVIDNNWTYVNAAIDTWSGDRKEMMISQFNKIKELGFANVDVVLIAYGFNDWDGGALVDNDNNQEDTTTFCGALRVGIDRMYEENPNIRIYIVTPGYAVLERDSETGEIIRDSSTEKKNGINLQEYGNTIEDCCKKLHLPCFNQYCKNNINEYNANVYLADGIHRNELGYKLLGEQYSKFIFNF